MRTRRIHSQKGFSIVELMLALGLGLVVVTGIVQLFIGNSQTSALIAGQARLQENARFAFDFISRATRRAGYFGCSPEAQNIVRGLVGDYNLLPEYDITRFIEGHESDGAGGWNPPLTGLPGGTPGNTNDSPAGEIDTALLAAAATPSDVLVVRNLQEPGQTLTQTLQPLANPVVTAPGGNPGFGIGDIVMVADCEQGAVFRVTGLNVAGNTATVLHVAGAGFFDNAVNVNSPVGIVPFTLSFLGRSYGPEAVVGAIGLRKRHVANRPSDAAVAVFEGVDGDEPEVCDTCFEDGVDRRGRARPLEERRHLRLEALGSRCLEVDLLATDGT